MDGTKDDAFIITETGHIHHGRVLGRRGQTSMFAVVDERGLVRTAHGRHLHLWLVPDREQLAAKMALPSGAR